MDDFNRQVRRYIYEFMVERGRSPSAGETAGHFEVAVAVAKASYQWLHDNHLLFLEPGTYDVRMAWPLSAVKTDYRVRVNEQWLWANCAWDALGIPAMLGTDATITALYADTREPVQYVVENGQLQGMNGVVHFALPFRQWYDDLIFT